MRSLILVACLLFAIPVWAAPALVKSGEHENYSRLVLYTGGAQEWQRTSDGEKVSISLVGWSSGFDISEVFELIPRDRIAALTQSASGLKLTLACDCAVIIAPVEQGGIMIDVADQLKSATKNSTLDLPLLNDLNPVPFSFPQKDAIDVTALRRRLTESIGKAATQELLIASPSNSLPNSKISSVDNDRRSHPAPERRIRSTSASERAAQAIQPVTSSETCPPDRYGDIENWGTKESYSSQISELRMSMVREFDSINTATALRLAQLYVYFAMGAEALATLQSLDVTSTEALFLKPLAKLVDGDPTGSTTIRTPTNGCTGSHAIWAALLGNQIEAITAPQAKVISEAFSHLPHHLKSILGPPLMSRLKGGENEVAASVIQNSISISTSEETTHTALAKLSTSELEDLITRGGAETPSAIVAFLHKKVAQSEVIDESIRDISRSYEVQQHGETAALEIGKLLTMDTANRGEFVTALDNALVDLTEPDRGEAISYISNLLAEKGNDLMVAKFALRLQNTSSLEHLEDRTKKSISQRLRQMGMGALAASVSNQPIENKTNDQARLHQDNQISVTPKPQPSVALGDPTLLGATSVMEDSQRLRERITNLLTPSDEQKSN